MPYNIPKKLSFKICASFNGQVIGLIQRLDILTHEIGCRCRVLGVMLFWKQTQSNGDRS